MVKNLQYFVVLIALAAMAAGFAQNKKIVAGSIRTIVIDPGHGGKDPGCNGAIHKEKDVALAVALKLGKYIEENLKDVKVIFTRTTDVFVELEDRAQIANKAKADLFISIHCNAAGKVVVITDPVTGKKHVKMRKNKKGKMVPVETTNPVPFGTETYVMGLKNEEGKMRVATRENSAILYEDNYEKKYGGFDPESLESYIIMSNYTSAYVIQSASLAMKIQEEYARKAGRIDKGVHRQSIWVLWRTSMPSILTEVGYLTNPLEETFLGSEKGQEYLAKGIFRGLRKYKDEVEGTKKEYNDEFENQVPLENENVLAGNLPGQKKAADDDDDDDDDTPKKPEEKKPEPVKEIVPVKEILKEPEVKKEKVDDGKYTSIDLKKSDTAATHVNSEDSADVSAKNIADKFKKDKPADREPLKPKETIIAAKPEVVFKVQFASSDVELNLKQEKFAMLLDADFYRVNNALKYTSGKFASLNDAIAHKNMLRQKGFPDCFVIAVKNGQRIDINEARKLVAQ